MLDCIKKQLSSIKADKWSVFLIGVSIFTSLFWLNWKIEPSIRIDSDLYIKLADQMSSFNPSLLTHRTPLMPLFIAVVKKFLGLRGIVIVQMLFGAGSILLVNKIVLKISKNQVLAGLTALILAFDPLVISYQPAIMSETLGLFFLMLFFYLHLQLFNKLTKKRLILTVINDLLLIISRPVFIILPIGIHIYHLISSRRIKIKIKRKFIMAAIAVNCLFLMGYQSINYYYNGFFGMTVISQINLLGKIIQYGYLEKIVIDSSTPKDVNKILFAYQDNPKEKSPYSLLLKSHPNIHSSLTLTNTLQPVTQYFFSRKWQDYLIKTTKLIPQTITAERPSYNPNDFDRFEWIKVKINTYFNKINRLKLIVLGVWLAIFTKWYLIERKIIGYQLGLLLAGIIYTVVMISIFSHSEYVRLRLPVEPWLNSLVIVPVIYWSLKFLKKYGKNN